MTTTRAALIAEIAHGLKLIASYKGSTCPEMANFAAEVASGIKATCKAPTTPADVAARALAALTKLAA